MRHLSDAEVLNLNKLLQMETNAITKSRMMMPAINDEKLRASAETTVLACEMRIRQIQQFINENDIIDMAEVH